MPAWQIPHQISFGGHVAGLFVIAHLPNPFGGGDGSQIRFALGSFHRLLELLAVYN